MKITWKDFLRKCQFPLTMALGTLPVPVLLIHNFAPEHLGVLGYFPLAYVLLAWLCLATPGKLRVPIALAGSAGLMYLGFQLFPVAQNIPILLIPIMYVFMLLFGLRISGWGPEGELPIAWLATCAICHIAGQLMVNVAHNTGNKPVFITAAPYMMFSFIACLALCMLSLNRGTMHNASMGRQRVPVMMRRRNIIISMGILALILFIAALPEVIRAVGQLWQYLLIAIIAVMNFFAQFMGQSSGGGGGGGGGMDFGELGPVPEPSAFALFMEKVITIVAAVLVVVLAVFLLYKLWQKLRIFLKYLSERLSLFAHISSEDFEDEITDTRDEGEKERISLMDKMRRRFARVDEKKLTPTQRIRYRYLRLIVKHPEWHTSQTARETLPEHAAALYERARYSGEEASDQDADAFTERIRNL